MIIKKIDETNERVGEFINKAFTDYAIKCCVELNFEEYCFVAEEDGEIVGAITGRAYYNEVHIGDLIIDENKRERCNYCISQRDMVLYRWFTKSLFGDLLNPNKLIL